MGIRLGLPKGIRRLELGRGVAVEVRPLTTAIYEQVKASAFQAVRDLSHAEDMIEGAGGEIAGMPDLSTEAGRAGYSQYLFAVHLACAGIVAWVGVEDEGGAVVLADLDQDERVSAITEVMSWHDIAEKFVDLYTKPFAELASEGEGSVALVEWGFGEGPDYCLTCRETGAACALGECGRDGHRCPFLEHAPRTPEGQQFWSLLQACHSQLRIEGMGRSIGFDLPALLAAAEAWGLEAMIVVRLLPFADEGLRAATAVTEGNDANSLHASRRGG